MSPGAIFRLVSRNKFDFQIISSSAVFAVNGLYITDRFRKENPNSSKYYLRVYKFMFSLFVLNVFDHSFHFSFKILEIGNNSFTYSDYSGGEPKGSSVACNSAPPAVIIMKHHVLLLNPC